MRLVTAAICALISIGSVNTPNSQDAYPRAVLRPVDEAIKDASLVRFRVRLRQLVRSKDRAALADLIDPAVRAGVLSGLIDEVGLNGRSQWDELARVLRLGGAFTQGRATSHEFCAPYAYSEFPSVGQISNELLEKTEGKPWVVVASDVRVHEKPSKSSRVVGRLSYELVAADGRDARDDDGEATIWQFVDLPNGRSGFVADQFLWEPSTGYHACFTKTADSWQMMSFERGR